MVNRVVAAIAKTIGVPLPTVAASVGVVSLSPNRDTAKKIENAMSEAVTQAYAEKINDPKVIRQRMLAARQHVKDQM